MQDEDGNNCYILTKVRCPSVSAIRPELPQEGRVFNHDKNKEEPQNMPERLDSLVNNALNGSHFLFETRPIR